MSDNEETMQTTSAESTENKVNGSESMESSEEKVTTTADSKSEEKEEDEEESESEEEKVGLLEQPILVEGKRVRKSVERLATELSSPSPAVNELKIPEGKGTKLGDCKRIAYNLERTTAEDLKPLHRLMFGREAKAHLIKKNIRLFCGYDFEVDSAEYKRKLELLNRFFVSGLKFLCETLDLERKGTKEEIADRVWKFLQHPKDSGKALPEKKKSASKNSSKKKKNSTSISKKSSKTKEKVKDISEDANSDAESASSLSSDEDTPAPKKRVALPKVKATPQKKKVAPSKKAAAQKKGTKKEASVAKKKNADSQKGTPKKTTPKRKPEHSDDDEPLTKKSKDEPTNKELKALLKKLLDGADLSTMTMKIILHKVYDNYPDYDLTARKDFIKRTVKDMIS